jgi:hypothetical protein
MRRILTAACLAAPIALGLLPALAAAEPFEQPPSFNAAKLRGINRVGANYSIASPVQSDGLLRDYVLITPYGNFSVRGDEMVKMRINELYALSLLEKVSGSQSFAKALAQAGLNPIKYTGKLITNPIGTVRDTLSGVDAMFRRIGSGLSNAGKTPDNALASVLGVTDERRKLAAAYGVDPYTDFPPLDAKLKQLSEASALGGLAVTGALMAIPGAAGIVVSNLSTVTKINSVALEDLARNYTAAQLLDLNRGLLAHMGVPPDLSERLLSNTNYTPIDMTVMLGALDSMGGVEDRAVYIARAAEVDQRFIAFFMRRRAELMAVDERRHRDYARFVSLAGYPCVQMRDGRIEALVPIDALSWTPQTAAGFTEMSVSRRQYGAKVKAELRITGEATVLAKKQMRALGWALAEKQ